MPTDTDRLQELAGLIEDIGANTYTAHPHRGLGTIIVDKTGTLWAASGAAVGIIDTRQDQALVKSDPEYDELADRLETAGVSVDRREAGEGDP